MANRRVYMRGGSIRPFLAGWVWAVKPFAALFALLTDSTFQLAHRPALGAALHVPIDLQSVRNPWGIL
jgi:hypothetical protein